KNGYTFLYWAKGLELSKRILGFDAELTYIPTENDNIVIAVYEKADGTGEVAKAEFYSGNGQLVATLGEGEKAPVLPEIPGRDATHWENRAGVKLDAGEDVTLAGGGTEIWVAQYDAAVKKVSVTAKDATGAREYAYGERVTLEADIPEGKTFRYWKKTLSDDEEEIVGFNSTTYYFYAWEDCTVEAVCGDALPVYTGNAMKILIDTFGNNSVMAEFIGFGDVTILEKGISLDGTDFAMTSDKMQFTLSDIGSAAAKGYAIIKEGETVYRIEDGE
ncbi:MAG: hypothetical protein IIV97_02315, partial [Oscillospiraceae bacterium]|nr:hypothetical protein [Oscillospiraceae bacterium]